MLRRVIILCSECIHLRHVVSLQLAYTDTDLYTSNRYIEYWRPLFYPTLDYCHYQTRPHSTDDWISHSHPFKLLYVSSSYPPANWPENLSFERLGDLSRLALGFAFGAMSTESYIHVYVSSISSILWYFSPSPWLALSLAKRFRSYHLERKEFQRNFKDNPLSPFRLALISWRLMVAIMVQQMQHPLFLIFSITFIIILLLYIVSFQFEAMYW